MIVVTTNDIPGMKITKVVGLARGSAIRARHIGKDILAGLKNIVGGEMVEYTKLLAESREQAVDRMVEDAESKGANAIVGMRFMTSSVAQGAAEMLAFGTAVVVEGAEGSEVALSQEESRS